MPLKAWTPSPSYTNVTYTPAWITATATERLSVFYPDKPAPATGYPVMLWFNNPGFQGGSPDVEILTSSVFLYECLDRGIVVVSASCTQTKDVSAGGPPGAGTFDPPFITSPPEQAHWDNPAFPNCVKSAVHAIQWVRENAVALGIDPNKIGTGGRSGGSAPAMWLALAKDLADPSISAPGQFRAGISSRANALVAVQMHAWWSAHVQSGPTAVPQAYAPKLSNPVNQVALNGADTFAVYQARFSPLSYGLNETLYSGVQALNATAKVFLLATTPVFAGLSTPPTEADFAFTVADQPVVSNKITDNHDGWHPVVLYRRMKQLNPEHWERYCRCVFRADHAGGWGETHTTPAGSLDPGLRMAAEWLADTFGLSGPGVPVAEQVVREVVSRLTDMADVSVYHHRFQQVRRGAHNVLNGPYPTANVVISSIEYMDRGEEMTDSVTGRMRLSITFLHHSPDEAQQRVLESLDDVRTALFDDPQLNGLALDTQVVSAEILHSLNGDSALAGCEMEVEITYRSSLDDLTTAI